MLMTTVKLEQGHVVRVASGPGRGRKGTVRFRTTDNRFGEELAQHTVRVIWDEIGTSDSDVNVQDLEAHIREGRHLVWRQGR
jgi:hypothetical protein